MIASLYVATLHGRGSKIGRSADPASRVKQIGKDMRGQVVLAAHTGPTPLADEAEALAHWLLRDKHLGGEWFDVLPDDAFAVARDAIARAEAGERADRRINNASPYATLKEARVTISLPVEDLEALDAWRAKERIWSRSEAIRRLVAEGVNKAR